MMRRTLLLIAIILACFLVSCSFKQPPVVQSDAPLRLTSEEILQADDGTRIIVYFPDGVERPVVFKSTETGAWIASGKVVED